MTVVKPDEIWFSPANARFPVARRSKGEIGSAGEADAVAGEERPIRKRSETADLREE
jgi:hypothetical protein